MKRTKSADSDSRQLDFICIGAPRSGTTWLYRVLRSNPNIFVSEKEIHFFIKMHGRDLYAEETLDWYLSKFSDASPEQMIGEVAVGYLRSSVARDRIYKEMPDVKLFVVLRNPIRRAWSSYQNLKGRKAIDVGFDDFLHKTALGRQTLQDGLAYRHLSMWLEKFPRDRLKIILFDEIQRTPLNLIESIFSYLGVDNQFDHSLLNQKVNMPLKTRSKVFSRLYFNAASWLSRKEYDRAKAVLRATGIPKFLLRLNRGRITKPETMPTEMREKLRRYYSRDIKGLESLLNTSLEHWR